MKKLLVFFLILTSTKAIAQCRSFMNEPIDSLQNVVSMVERISGYHLFTTVDLSDSARLSVSYNVVKEERGSKGESLVTVTARYGFKRKIVDGDVVTVRTGINSLTIAAPRETACLILKEIKKGIASCVLKDGGTFILFGEKGERFKLVSYTDCYGDALFGTIFITNN